MGQGTVLRPTVPCYLLHLATVVFVTPVSRAALGKGAMPCPKAGQACCISKHKDYNKFITIRQDGKKPQIAIYAICGQGLNYS